MSELPTMLSAVLGDDQGHMTIHQCQAHAKKCHDQGKIMFDLVGPNGRLACWWLDPFLGFFKYVVEGKECMGTMRQFDAVHGLHVENLDVEFADPAPTPGQTGER